MKTSTLKKLIGTTVASLCFVSVNGLPAVAGQLHNGWNYGIDSFIDGSGGESFNIRGIAIKETSDSIFVALTGGTPLTGVYDSVAADKNIGWGDLFLNFTNKNFTTASSQKSLFGVRFAGMNDSGVATTGLYGNVKGASVTSVNHGYNSLKQYYGSGFDKANTQGTDIATKAAAYSYFGETTPILNVIDSGATQLGGIVNLSATALQNQGLDFGFFNAKGSQTLGFSFNKSDLGLADGNYDYIASIFLECGNDGVALKGGVSVPEPGSLAGLALVGLTVLGSRLSKRQS
ncbi:XDD3 family exosortase-dependent surface protein [Planktothrix mougeotii]|uniref:PEP-CTERM sorting domain-containing protein n=1 Tax=Planktothrix mougeotii LEGE 06226 TaxID=1828728 RepID=A0ABR9U8V4_9CYAN|nr:XDD3 family exosortase-dependent surface protein [Planktothrix mougeotii]MBE9142872.1 PEP-CTERM sorting domain-containing protein [Planktothrix mougeotii LEGE 06226]